MSVPQDGERSAEAIYDEAASWYTKDAMFHARIEAAVALVEQQEKRRLTPSERGIAIRSAAIAAVLPDPFFAADNGGSDG